MNSIKIVKISIPLLLLLAIGYFLWHGLSLNPTLVPSPFIGKKTPEFNLQSLFKPQKTLSNQLFQGKVSLLNVWATWCVTCADEYPELVSIANTNIVPIYGLDYKDQRTSALAWIEKYGNPFKAVGFDPSGNVAIDWGVYGTPETFVIDKNGIIRYKQVGPITNAIWNHTILPLIRKLQAEK